MTASDGVRVAVHDYGGPDHGGPDLLLVHATGLHGRVWDPVVAHLADRFRCVSLDERGHGDSGRPEGGDFRWGGFALDVLAVVDGLGLRRPVAAGHSCGGAALLLAEEARPGTFSALWCYEPIVPPVDPPMGHQTDNPLAVGARRRRSSFPSRRAAYENYASKPPFDAVDPAALAAYVEFGLAPAPDGTVTLKCRPEDEAETFAHSGTHDAYLHLDRVGCPVTLCYGETTEAAFGRPTVLALAGRLGSARVEEMAGLGHFGPLQDPARVAASMAGALAPG